ncbi:MAG: hypothetical protein M1817_006850 [Caeruleum heppii]|nr:MAG: hypothetical protein M1817_006850 [Caeruleum heppii]
MDDRSEDQWRHQEGSDTSSEDGHRRNNTQYRDPMPHDAKPAATGDRSHSEGSAGFLEVFCGPLLNYNRMGNDKAASPMWYGSVLIVTAPGPSPAHLELSCVGRAKSATNGGQPDGQRDTADTSPQKTPPVKLYSDPDKTFWRYEISLPLQGFEAEWAYSIPDLDFGNKGQARARSTFFVPSKDESMRIMFHSCNGFSVGTDETAWSGTALWHDVLRIHETKPFHVMIGGGDQIYNDGIRVAGPLRTWTALHNPKRRREYPFNESLRAECDEYYFQNYVRWYSADPFAVANRQIPQVNIWDDHDIIDGFGSYTDRFMQSHVFRGVGGVAHKYYMLFQHHFPPPASTFTSDAPASTAEKGKDTGADPAQTKNSYVMTNHEEDPKWIIGTKPGPYVQEASRSLYMQLGAHIAFVGLDARTERTRHQINYPETYDLLFDRVGRELSAAQGSIKHLVVLLGVPIAYPRLIWLENILTSPIIGPIRFLNKRFGVAGSFFNHFDGQVDLLDDLDDHYTARQHKKERKQLIQRLQQLALAHSARVSIVSGDVHLGALGRFYSHPKLQIPAEDDHRYMANVISSAITNKPPPRAVANMLAARNKIHHLDHDTDETLLNLFDRDPGGVNKTAAKNHSTMPSRNYAILSETAGSVPSKVHTNADAHPPGQPPKRTATGRDGHKFLHFGEWGAGASHPAATGVEPSGTYDDGGLDVCLRVEIDPSDAEGRTEGYGFCIPPLTVPRRRNEGGAKGEKMVR